MKTDVTEILQQLVRIPSVNPMGLEVSDDQYYENRLTDFLQSFFNQLGLPWHRQQVALRRDNIIARLDGTRSENQPHRLLAFEVHQDTVPVDGMTIDPWDPIISNGRLYGRGSCDVKGGMACMLAAMARLATQRPSDLPSIIMACTVNEENGFTGAREMSAAWRGGNHPLVPQLPDAMIVAEPTSLDIVVAHKGVVRWRCHARGRAAHSSCPELGENAIYHMGRALVGIHSYNEELSRRSPHPRLGSPTISVGTITGGICVNSIPDLCTIEIDRRLQPDECPESARQHVIDWLREHTSVGDKLEHDAPFLASSGLSNQTGGFPAQLQTVVHELAGSGNLIGVPYGTDAPFFADLGIPTVVFGPGSIQQAHTAAEWVPVDELHTATDALCAVASRFRRVG